MLLKWCVTRNRTQIFLPSTLFDRDTLATKVPSGFAFAQSPGHGSRTSPSPAEDRECMRAHVHTLPGACSRACEGACSTGHAPPVPAYTAFCIVFTESAPVAKPNSTEIVPMIAWQRHALEQQRRGGVAGVGCSRASSCTLWSTAISGRTEAPTVAGREV